MFLWVYAGVPKDNKFVPSSKMCIKYEDVLYAESIKGDPPGVLWIALRTGGVHCVRTTQRDFLEHLKSGSPLLLAPTDQPEVKE